LNFNLAHSGKLALFGMTLKRQIGIDVERISRDFPCEEIARLFFSSSEVAHLSSLPAAARPRAFFNCWTRKEAFIKAKGLGLSLPLDQFDVALGAEEPTLLCTRWDESESARWSLHALDLDHGYVGAVAVEGRAVELSFWQVDEKSIGRLREDNGLRS
jgi:4'-phosphopantetheinyl transferase